MDEYCVLLKSSDALKPVAVAEALAKFRKVPVQDMLAPARSCWGIVGERLPSSEAADLAAHFSALGMAAVAAPQTLVEDIPAPVAVPSIHLETPIPFAPVPDKPSSALSWTDLTIIAAGGFRQVTTVKAAPPPESTGMKEQIIGLGLTLATGIPIKIGGKSPAPQKPAEVADFFCYLDLVFAKPAARIRIDAQNFDYSCLKAKMGYSALANFKILVAEIANRCPAAIRGNGTNVIIQGRPMRDMGYESLKDLERECRWLITLRALRLK